jgi:hypothetical protein
MIYQGWIKAEDSIGDRYTLQPVCLESIQDVLRDGEGGWLKYRFLKRKIHYFAHTHPSGFGIMYLNNFK